jgi:hypothetical protein
MGPAPGMRRSHRGLMSAVEPVLRLFLLEAPTPALAALQAALPEFVGTPLGLEIPLRGLGPEEVLSLCLRFGVTARATCIVERTIPG